MAEAVIGVAARAVCRTDGMGATKDPGMRDDADTRMFFQVLTDLLRDGSSPLTAADVPELHDIFLLHKGQGFSNFARLYLEELADLRSRLPAATSRAANPRCDPVVYEVLVALSPQVLALLRARLNGGSVAAVAADMGWTGRQAWIEIAAALSRLAPKIAAAGRGVEVAELVWRSELSQSAAADRLRLSKAELATEVVRLAEVLADALETLPRNR